MSTDSRAARGARNDFLGQGYPWGLLGALGPPWGSWWCRGRGST